MDVAIKKVGMRDGKERFVLVNAKTRAILTVKDVTEPAIRRFFQKQNVGKDLVDKCLDAARRRYSDSAKESKVDESADTMGEDDLLFELGLDDDANVH